MSNRLGSAIVAIGLMALDAWAAPARAASVTWTGSTSTAWNTTTNWLGGVVPAASGDSVIFSTNPTSQPSNNDLSSLSLSNLTILSSTFSSSLSLGGNAFTLAAPSSVTGASFARTSGNATVTVTQANHGLTTGQFVTLATGSVNTDGVYQVTVTSGSTFTYSSGTNTTLAASGTYTLAALTLSNTTGNRTTTIANDVAISGAQTWGFLANANTALIVSGNLSGAGNLTIGAGVASNSASTLPNLRLTGANNSGYTGTITFTPADSGLLLGSAGAMTGGLIDINGNNRNVWLTGGAGSGTYAFGIGGTEVSGGRVQFRGAGTSGLYLTGGDVSWNPGGGTSYVWSGTGTGNTTIDFDGSNDSTPRMLYLGNAVGNFVVSAANKSFRNGVAGNNPGRVTLLSALADGNEGTARTLTTDLPLLALTKAAVNQNAAQPLKVTVSGGGLAITNLNQLPNGNLNLSAGALILDNISWSTLVAGRPIGTGTGQFQLTGGGFAARTADLTIPNDSSGGLSASTFDKNVVIGSGVLDADGTLYAKAGVTIARDTTLSAARTYTVGANGVGLNAGTPVLNKITANLSGAGSIVVGGATNMGSTAGTLVLAGTNSWTGASSTFINTGVYINTGSGGLQVSNAVVQFPGDSSLPGGNGGGTAYVSAIQRNSSSAFGYMLTGDEAGQAYDLPAGYRFLLGSMSTSANYETPLLGAAGGMATLQASTVLVHAGGAAADSIAMNLLVRANATLSLGSGTNRVKLVPSTGQSSGTSAVATTVSDGSGTRTLIKRGEGTLVLGNVAYTNVAETGTTASQFAWQIGRANGGNSGTTAYFDGAVRGLSPNDAAANDSNSLRNFFMALRGGVYEIDNSGGGSGVFTATLGISGTGKVSVGNVSGNTAIGGGGFSAYGGNVIVILTAISGTTTNLQWNQSSSGFVQSGDALLFGSETATKIIDFTNAIDLNGGFREVRVLDNTASAGDYAVISGIWSGNSTSGLNKTGAGLLELAAANTYSGTTTASAGTLRIANNLALQNSVLDTSGTGAVTLTVTTPTLGGLVGSTNLASLISSGYGTVSAITFNPGSGLTRTYTGAIADGAAGMTVTKTGSGTQILGGANSYTGNTTISTGTLQLGVGVSLPGDIANSASLVLQQGGASVGEVGGIVSGAGTVTISGTGAVRLSNAASTYTGRTTIASGVLEAVVISGSGVAGSLGAATGGNATIDLGAGTTSGTLRYVGTTSSTSNRVLNLAGSTGGGAIDASGAGALVLTAVNTATGAGAKTLMLTGTSTAGNSIGVIADNSLANPTSLTKSGVGSWTLSAANTFTGQAYVSQGTLIAANPQALGGGGAALVGGTDAGLGGVAALLLAGTTSLNRLLEIVTSGSGTTQTVILGGANTSGTTSFGSAIVRVGRDVTLQSASGGAVRFSSNWTGASGSGSITDRSFTFGGHGNAGTVIVSSSIATNSGSMTVAAGILRLADQIMRPGTGQRFTILADGELAGTGTVAAVLGGAGAVGPGNSPGILVADGVDPAGGLDFDFEFTDLAPLYTSNTSSANDVLRLTGAAPFTQNMTGANSVDIYFPAAVLTTATSPAQTYRGGFFTDSTAAQFAGFQAAITGAVFTYYVSDPSGTISYKGNAYSLLPGTILVTPTTSTVASAGFSGGTVTNGQIMTFVVVPEPGTLAQAVVGVVASAWILCRRISARRGKAACAGDGR